jgi:hypothetical protein
MGRELVLYINIIKLFKELKGGLNKQFKLKNIIVSKEKGRLNVYYTQKLPFTVLKL